MYYYLEQKSLFLKLVIICLNFIDITNYTFDFVVEHPYYKFNYSINFVK
jgi:hypothetical protein